MVARVGVGPTSYGFSDRRSDRLSYRAIGGVYRDRTDTRSVEDSYTDHYTNTPYGGLGELRYLDLRFNRPLLCL